MSGDTNFLVMSVCFDLLFMPVFKHLFIESVGQTRGTISVTTATRVVPRTSLQSVILYFPPRHKDVQSQVKALE